MTVILSFAAYLTGSISVFLFSGLLARVIRQPREGLLTALSSLSKDAIRSLDQVVRDGRELIEDELALTGVDVAEVLNGSGERADAGGRIAALLPHEATVLRARDRQRLAVFDGPRGSLDVIAIERREQLGEIAARVLRDLPVIAESQLLGKDPEAFSAVDRSETEVEFRLALVPALFGLCVSVAALVATPAWSIVTIGIGALVVIALLLDAARRRRDANALILTLLEHNRAMSPSINRAVTLATRFADQRPDRVLRRNGEEAARLLRQCLVEVDAFATAVDEYLRHVDWLIDSGFLAGKTEAVRTSDAARGAGERLAKLLARLIPGGVALHQSVDGVIAPLTRVFDDSRAFFDAHAGQEVGSALEELRELVERNNRVVQRARIARDEWVTEMRDLVKHLAEEDELRSRAPVRRGQERATHAKPVDACLDGVEEPDTDVDAPRKSG
ncbi:hypothetical protein ABIB37_002617 [Agrococcus sp. UYP10]|uniref:hypothetical protein n=1 Tax=Agrococcus sp. UYP10 TaxID=1756355 RepID=UPI0033913010